jgi:hypothetical protein
LQAIVLKLFLPPEDAAKPHNYRLYHNDNELEKEQQKDMVVVT